MPTDHNQRSLASAPVTERLWELDDASETVEKIADAYDMAVGSVRAAIVYEEQLRSLTA